MILALFCDVTTALDACGLLSVSAAFEVNMFCRLFISRVVLGASHAGRMFGGNLADVPSLSQDSAPAEDFEVPEVEVPKSEAARASNNVTTMDDDVATLLLRSSARSNIGT